MIRRSCLIAALAVFAVSATAMAQVRTVSGTVRDSLTGEPLTNAVVTV